MDAEIIIWMIVFLGGYIAIVGYFVRVAMCARSKWK